MDFDLVIKNGMVITAETTYNADIGINGEKIVAIGERLRGKREIDAAGKYVIPGGVDIHVHMQMSLGDGVISSDDFFTGTRAAAFGGTTTIVDFVQSVDDEPLLDALAARRAEADPQVVDDYALHMTIGPNDITKLDQVPLAFAAGCTSFKLYMAYGLRLDDGQLLRALQAIKAVNGFPVIHAENWDIICTLVEQNLTIGRTEPLWHPHSRPAPLEGEAVGRAIEIATYVGTPLHIFHVSCEEAVQRIQAARAQGLPITGETCPQYLFKTEEAFEAPGVEGMLPVCSPPIRDHDQQAALWYALARGDLQIVTTDHCPFSKELKARGMGNYSKIPGGVPSIEMRLTSIYEMSVRTELYSLNQWVAMCCTTPAKLVGLSHKGHIAVGYDADIVIFDPQYPWAVSTETLHENVGWTLYDGFEFSGKPIITIRRGEVVIEDGVLKAAPGSGKYIHRQTATV